MAQYSAITSSTQIGIGLRRLKSIFVSSASSTPTITVYDSKSKSASDPVILDTFTPISATNYQLTGDELGVQTNNGLYVVISGTVSATVIYD